MIIHVSAGTTSNVTLGSGSLIDLSNNQESVGVYASNSNIIDNGGDIKVGVKGIGMQLINPLSMSMTGGTITGSTTASEAIGLYIESGLTPLQTSKNITLLGDKSVGIYVNDTSGSMNYTNTGTITVGNALSQSNPSVGIYSNAQSITEQGNITGGDNSIGLYSSKNGSTVKLDTTGIISVGTNGTGIYKLGGILQLDGTLKALGNDSVGAYIEGGSVTNNSTSLVIGNNAYGIVGVAGGTGTTNITNNSSNVTIGDNSVFIYSSDTGGTITNNANLTSTSNGIYGLYGIRNDCK
jgi:putative surface-exposed virulence protein